MQKPPHRSRSESGFTLVDALVSFGLFMLVVAGALLFFQFSGRSSSRITAQLALRQASRRAVVRLLKELQEGMEVVSPAPGCTLAYAVVRDKMSVVRWFYQLPQKGHDHMFELVRYTNDPDLPRARRTEVLLSGIRRLTFTSRSEGALQIHLLLADEDQEYSILTTVRLRNLAAAEELW